MMSFGIQYLIIFYYQITVSFMTIQDIVPEHAMQCWQLTVTHLLIYLIPYHQPHIGPQCCKTITTTCLHPTPSTSLHNWILHGFPCSSLTILQSQLPHPHVELSFDSFPLKIYLFLLYFHSSFPLLSYDSWQEEDSLHSGVLLL